MASFDGLQILYMYRVQSPRPTMKNLLQLFENGFFFGRIPLKSTTITHYIILILHNIIITIAANHLNAPNSHNYQEEIKTYCTIYSTSTSFP